MIGLEIYDFSKVEDSSMSIYKSPSSLLGKTHEFCEIKLGGISALRFRSVSAKASHRVSTFDPDHTHHANTKMQY